MPATSLGAGTTPRIPTTPTPTPARTGGTSGTSGRSVSSGCSTTRTCRATIRGSTSGARRRARDGGVRALASGRVRAPGCRFAACAGSAGDADGDRRGLDAVAHAQLVEDVGHVDAGRLGADEQQ